MMRDDAVCCSVAGCCRVFQCVPVCCSVLQCVTVCCSVFTPHDVDDVLSW